MNLSIATTSIGAELARRLPYELIEGDVAAIVTERAADVDAFVLFMPASEAFRAVAPLMSEGQLLSQGPSAATVDPSIVVVDDAAQWVIPISGSNTARTNELAREVAALLEAEAVVTSEQDAREILRLDALPGFTAEGDVLGISLALEAGRRPRVINPLQWPTPPALGELVDNNDVVDVGESIVITDELIDIRAGVALLRPPSLVVGIGIADEATPRDVLSLLTDTLAANGLSRSAVCEIATIDRRADDPALMVLGLPVRSFTRDELSEVTTESSGRMVERAVTTTSVCEAAARCAAGSSGELIVEKQKSDTVTVAIARRRNPGGVIRLVSMGPGHAAHRTAAAVAAVRNADVIIGNRRVIDRCDDLLQDRQDVMSTAEPEIDLRVKEATAEAASGRTVAIVCEGDAGVFSLAPEVTRRATEEGRLTVELIPGVTSASAAGALVGSPFGSDHASVNLSDSSASWPVVAQRIRAIAETDMVVSFYNPKAEGRAWQLDAALTVLRMNRAPITPVAIVDDAYGDDQSIVLTTLDRVDVSAVSASVCVIIGASTSRLVGGRMISPV